MKTSSTNFTNNKIYVIGLICVCVVIIVAFFAPFLSPHDPLEVSIERINTQPNEHFLIGTDCLGRDILSKLIYGVSITFFVSLASTAISIIIGTSLGLACGHFGGWFDNIVDRILDIILAFPSLMIAPMTIYLIGPDIKNIVLVISIIISPKFAKLIRAEVLSLKKQCNIADDINNCGINSKQLVRNSLLPIIAQTAFSFSSAAFIEISLGCLGIGIQPPNPALGAILIDNVKHFPSPIKIFWSTTFILFTIFSFFILGYALKVIDAERKERVKL